MEWTPVRQGQKGGGFAAAVLAAGCRSEGVVRFMIAIDNYDHISLAFGSGAALQASRRIRAAISQWLGDQVDIHSDCGGVFYGTLAGVSAADGAIDARQARQVANRVLANPPVVPLELDHGTVWLSVTATWGLHDELTMAGARTQLAALGEEGRAPFFGQLPGRGEAWAARYRADMAAVANLLASIQREPLSGDGAASIGLGALASCSATLVPGTRSIGCAVSRPAVSLVQRDTVAPPLRTALAPTGDQLVYAWQPVRSAARPDDVLFHEMCPQLMAPDGTRRGLTDLRPALERLGLAWVLDRHLVDHALGLLEADPDIALCVQISPQSASDCARWSEVLRRMTGDRSVARRLTIAIAETASFPDFAGAVQFVARVQALGCVVAIDNFGMGYTSIRELLALAPDIVCIAPFFVHYGSTAVPEGSALGHLAGLAGMMAASVVVKGVATARQSRLALDVGVQWQQGDFLGSPGLGHPSRGGSGPCKLTALPRRRRHAA